jgi:flagellar protein FliS
MNRRETELSYRRAAVQNASSVGLVIILYDLLVEDLRKAIAAIERRDVEGRSAALKHGFSVLQQLQGSLDMKKGGVAAKNLARFYAVMRCRILEAHVKISSEILNEQIALLLDVRGAWQQVDPANAAPANAAPAAAAGVLATPAQTTRAGSDGEEPKSGWTA